MIHSFDTSIAEEYGLFEAILLNNIYYWLEHNRSNGRHYYDGKYWTYNSVGAYAELFPYMSKGKIERALKHLEEEGILVTGNYNKIPTDRTKWYALTVKGYQVVQHEKEETEQNEKCISQNQEMDSSDLRNAIPKNEEPIPYINTDNKPDNKTTESKDSVCQTDVRRSTRTDQDVAEVITLWNQLADIGINPVKGISSSSKRYKNLKARIRQYGIEPVKEAVEQIRHSAFLQGKNKNGWCITFDWFVLPNNFPKVLDGNYADKGGTTDGRNKTGGTKYHAGDYYGEGAVSFDGFQDIQ